MDSQQRNYPKGGYGAYTEDSYNNRLQTDAQSSSYFQSSSSNVPSKMSEYDSTKKPLVSGTDSKGFQYRSPEIGRVIPQGEIINRIVPYWELFISNAGLFGYHIVSSAAKNIGTDDALSILFFKGCNSEHAQSNLDVCATSILSWSLVGGSLLYLAFVSILAFLLFIECKRQGYPATFTALWNSPLFLVCYFFKENSRIDLLTIPNKFIGFKKWTRLHLHRLGLAIYSFITTGIIIYYLNTNLTVDQDDLKIQKQYKAGDTFYKIYNPFFLPYYAAMYFYVKTILSSVIEIKNFSDFENAELVGINYASLKIH
ncbi:hypothetical protein RhiirA5_464134 [Rhizophagus irregularis]|uniref:Uncharacterized protein n=3 Tax=Rhizophagus irregularis TaxID=588596 RepID=A0A2I1GB11_9GLOM|nr:hypothetical protein GLOIN_2v1783535 [Rhizophagus irregularis DAOM 181602=DAOM 197198]EXX57060.1 hypothetical protein RirG_210720 [Rhizophagus irregularis DAOM 197198w]PKC12363.1 hypothetical protein RhiirA5_464134 [Rhizophagus irregularis]PKC70129.1 hypothetical protein RhiirA1_455204 [Rhizophagus irregularis]PKK76038.1 hypothetical protein RhiirC2_707692 [Rhizophagus irregularis]PKY18315.1 hypothetical protein RhiirB3_431096 [Rhizophagus irregularis]|eukprot:XP_025170778.1 hypothetical protein GLOIN_2v1783535 [Rhizophagus irregularis DAOM 181602=DAOM 197198]